MHAGGAARFPGGGAGCHVKGMPMEDLASGMLAIDPRLCVIAASGYPVDIAALQAKAPGRVISCISRSRRRCSATRCGGCLPRKKQTFDAGKEVRAIARERVGSVPAGSRSSRRSRARSRNTRSRSRTKMQCTSGSRGVADAARSCWRSAGSRSSARSISGWRGAFRILRNGRSKRRYLRIHGNEETARQVLERHMNRSKASRIWLRVTSGDVTVEGLKLDPNRMFSRVGAEANCDAEPGRGRGTD